MTDLVDLAGIKTAIEGISEQISTAINIDKVNKRVDELSKENLLINWYFKRPVNQRRLAGVITYKYYTIDRWKLVDGEVEITANGLKLNGTIQQPLEFAVGQDTVATVLTTDGIREAEYDDTSKIFQITSEGETLIAAKLEIGTKQTLAHLDVDGSWILNDTPPNYQQELAKCQRFFLIIGKDGSTLPIGISASKSDNGGAFISIPVPVPMRIYPTIEYYAPSGLGTFSSGGLKYTATSILSNGQYRYERELNIIPCNIKIENFETAAYHQAGILRLMTDAYVMLNSEL